MDTLMGRNLLTKTGDLVDANNVLSKNVSSVIYLFSAEWVRTKPEFLEILRKVYELNQKRKKSMEIIYVSSDEDQEIFMKEFQSEKHGHWYAIPFYDQVALELRYKYNITSLPSIIVVKLEGDLITNHGREELENMGLDVLVTWDNSMN